MTGHPLEDILAPERLRDARLPLERAFTLPSEAFTSREVFETESDLIFSREWLCAGRADQIPARGDYFGLDLLGEKLVVVRDGDGQIRVLSRVCRHRGAEIVSGAGNGRSFQCPYHAWTYQLDGLLLGAPFMEGADGFDRRGCRLPEIASEVWEGWIFVNFDPKAEPLGPRLEPLRQLLADYRMSEMVAVETAVFDSPFNWKVLVDNFMEAYHHIAIHRDTFEPLFPAAASHSPENHGPYSVLIMPPADSRPDEPGVEALPSLPEIRELPPELGERLVAVAVFPFHLFAPSAGSLTWYQLLPLGFDRFTLRIYSCFPEETLRDPQHRGAVEALQALTRRVHEQDIQACEATWAGLNSRCFESGRLSPLEKPIWQFNQWWMGRMRIAAPAPHPTPPPQQARHVSPKQGESR